MTFGHITAPLQNQRVAAKQGDLFWCNFTLSNGQLRRSPVMVVGNDADKVDVIVAKCTTQPAKSQFDVNIPLAGWNACVRVNKLYTIERNQLLNPVSTASPIQMALVLAQLRVVFDLK